MKKWLITGVSSGFGYELTKQLLERGDTVIGTVRNTDKVQPLIEKYGEKFDCRILDVTDVPAVQNTVKESFKKHGKIDVVISNAGYGLFGAAEELYRFRPTADRLRLRQTLCTTQPSSA